MRYRTPWKCAGLFIYREKSSGGTHAKRAYCRNSILNSILGHERTQYLFDSFPYPRDVCCIRRIFLFVYLFVRGILYPSHAQANIEKSSENPLTFAWANLNIEKCIRSNAIYETKKYIRYTYDKKMCGSFIKFCGFVCVRVLNEQSMRAARAWADIWETLRAPFTLCHFIANIFVYNMRYSKHVNKSVRTFVWSIRSEKLSWFLCIVLMCDLWCQFKDSISSW